MAAVKNGLILATIWMMNFARTSFHIFSSRMARTDLLSDLIGGPLRALSILVKSFLQVRNCHRIIQCYLFSVREALSFSSLLLLLL